VTVVVGCDGEGEGEGEGVEVEDGNEVGLRS
jgi:hypothetical protein